MKLLSELTVISHRYATI